MWALSYEHSGGEAPAIFRAFEELTEAVNNQPPYEENSIPLVLPAPEKLEWFITESSRAAIRDAMSTFDGYNYYNSIFY